MTIASKNWMLTSGFPQSWEIVGSQFPYNALWDFLLRRITKQIWWHRHMLPFRHNFFTLQLTHSELLYDLVRFPLLCFDILRPCFRICHIVFQIFTTRLQVSLGWLEALNLCLALVNRFLEPRNLRWTTHKALQLHSKCIVESKTWILIDY